jgi:hypothetical protein
MPHVAPSSKERSATIVAVKVPRTETLKAPCTPFLPLVVVDVKLAVSGDKSGMSSFSFLE